MRDGATKWAEVDLDAIAHNARTIGALIGPATALMAVVKANGYGHGAVPCARAALRGGAAWLGVSSADEGLELRRAGIQAPTLILGYTPEASLAAAAEAGLSITLYEGTTLEALRRLRPVRPVPVHVKVDTGMHRLGAPPSDAIALVEAVRSTSHLRLEGLFTHFADADGGDPAFTRSQLEALLEVRRRALEAGASGFLSHAANSAGLLRFPESRLDLARAGIILYGIPPATPWPAFPDLRQALRWATIVTSVRTVPDGETVGYGRRFTARGPRRVATLAAGYADGLFRVLSNRGSVVVRGRRVPIAGTVSMDQAGVDVSDVPGVTVGDVAWLIGSDGAARVSAEEVAAAAGTIAYEVLCAISSRVPRRYRGEA
ncbi:MAG: alanine racemase [Chloroflexi bacterium]|nr:MAG: alanine racemase [Chloroflexota bacterium]